MKCIKVVLLLLLVIPILCLDDKREKILKRSSKIEKARGIEKKLNKASESYIFPDTPLHLSGYSFGHYVIMTDETINVISRSKKRIYLWVFSYFSFWNDDNTLSLSEISINEEKSKFIFSSTKGKSDCDVEYGKEYTYKELKDNCTEYSEIKNMVLKIERITKMSCVEDQSDGISRTKCEINDYYNTVLNQQHEINYKLNNMKIGTYSPSTEFYYIDGDNLINIRGNKMIKVEYREVFNVVTFIATYKDVTVTDEKEFTRIKGELFYDDYYICLASDCKYIFRDLSMLFDNDGDWGIYNSVCYVRGNNFDSEFNSIYRRAYYDAKNYNPDANNLRRSLLEEYDERRDKSTTSAKGYYYEDLSYGYKGYFVIDNELILIKQIDAAFQAFVKQLKLVLNLDETTNSVRIEGITDSDIDQTKSGVEPLYDGGDEYESCKSFIPLKDVFNSKYSKCSTSIYDISHEFTYKEYNISKSGSEMILKIHDTEYDYNEDQIITLTEYDSTKLREIINKITKFTKPIPDDKCLRHNVTKPNSEFVTSLYNKVFYYNSFSIEDGTKTVKFLYTPKRDNLFYYTYDYNMYNSYIDIGNNQFLMKNGEVYYHKYVDFKGYDLSECNEVKNDALQIFEDRINEIKMQFGIEDGSVEYMMNIFLMSILLIIFI